MAKVRFHPIVEWFTGKMGNLVFRRSHNGKVSVYEAPYMEGIKWSPAQKDHRQRLGEASKYASAAVADPDIRPVYWNMYHYAWYFPAPTKAKRGKRSGRWRNL